MAIDQLEERVSKALKAAIVSVPDTPPTEWADVVRNHPSVSAGRADRGPVRRVWVGSIAASVFVLAVAGAVVVALLPSSQNPATLAARLLSNPPVQAPAPTAAPHAWSLVSDVTDSGWHVDPEGPVSAAGAITCATNTTCYVVSGGSDINPAVSPTPGTVLNVSENLGLSWAQYQMPSGLGLTSALTCPTGDGLQCVAGGTDNGGAALLTTLDGGAQWSEHPLPARYGSPTEMSCASMAECVGLFRTPVNPLSFGETVNANNEIYLGGTLSASIYSTHDGGQTWQRAALPAGDVPQSVSCTPGRCVVIAATPDQTVSGHITKGAVFSSGDGGGTWKGGALPIGFGVVWSGPSQVDCVTVSTCWATGTALAPDPAYAVSTSLVSVVASSDDGGLTWQVHSIPADVSQPRLYSISCPTAQQCWLGGWNGPDSVTLPPTSIVLSTRDAGSDWDQDSLDVGSGTLIGAISCPASNVCVGLGGVNAGSGRVSVYSNANSPALSG